MHTGTDVIFRSQIILWNFYTMEINFTLKKNTVTKINENDLIKARGVSAIIKINRGIR